MGKKLTIMLGTLFSLASLLILIMPFVYAASIQDSVQQQLGQNAILYQGNGQPDPNQVIMQAIKDNPQVFAQLIIMFIILIILIIADLILRGFAMWKASKRNQKAWFWCLLIINTLCILPIIYLIIYRKKKEEKKN